MKGKRDKKSYCNIAQRVGMNIFGEENGEKSLCRYKQMFGYDGAMMMRRGNTSP